MISLKGLVFLVSLSALCNVSLVLARLQVIAGKKCGEIRCNEHEYCTSHDSTCRPCERICSQESSNFQEDTCENECQDYLHDIRYWKHSNGSNDVENLYNTIQKDILILKILVGISLIVIAITIATFIAFVIYFWRFVRHVHSNPEDYKLQDDQKKGSTKEKSLEMPTIYSNKYEMDHSPNALKRRHDNGNENDAGSNNRVNHSPNKSREDSMNTLNTMNTSKTGITMSTIVNDSSSNTNDSNGNPPKFRKEPSESTIPDYMTYDSTSLSPSHNAMHFTHHV